MTKFKRAVQIIFILLLQVALTIIVSVSVVYMMYSDDLCKTVIMGDIETMSSDTLDSADLIEQHIEESFADAVITIKHSDEFTHNIKLSDIASLDYEAMLSEAQTLAADSSITTILKQMLLSQKRSVPFKSKIDADKLKNEVEFIAKCLNNEFVDAALEVKDGVLVKHPHTYGHILDEQSTLQWAEANIQNGARIIPLREGIDVRTIVPNVTDQDISHIDSIISEYSTQKKQQCDVSYLHIAAKAIDGVLVLKDETFSFIESLINHNCNVLDADGAESYNQVASTLYAGLLLSGINNNDIERIQSSSIPDYTSPGLEAIVEHGKNDLKFRNSLGDNIAVLSEIANDSIKVFIAGNSKLRNEIELVPETIETFMPGNVIKTNGTMPYGQTRIIIPGAEGMHVRVNRLMKKRMQSVKEVISDNIYKAVDQTLEVGTYNSMPK